MHFGISEGKGGLKHGSRPWLGMDIFWNCPFMALILRNFIHLKKNNKGTFLKKLLKISCGLLIKACY